MNNRELIFKSIERIEEKLRETITIPDIAKHYGFSSYYYSRLFKGITGLSPKNYIQSRKVTESAYDLIKSDKKIVDIAFDYDFGSHEVYIRAFQKVFHISPSEMRKQGCVNSALEMKPLTPEKVKQMMHLTNMAPELVEKNEIKLVGIPFYYHIMLKNDLSEPWSHLINQLSNIKNVIKPERFYQLQYWFPDQDNESIYFFVGIEVSAYKDIPIQLTAKTIPKHQYLRFYHKGYSNQVGHTYQYIYNSYLPNSPYKLPHLFSFEYYGQEHLGPYNEESISEIYIPVLVEE